MPPWQGATPASSPRTLGSGYRAKYPVSPYHASCSSSSSTCDSPSPHARHVPVLIYSYSWLPPITILPAWGCPYHGRVSLITCWPLITVTCKQAQIIPYH